MLDARRGTPYRASRGRLENGCRDRTSQRARCRRPSSKHASMLGLFLPEPVQPLHQAMHHVVFSGGKRIRPHLLLRVALASGIDDGNVELAVLRAACALELVHSASLVHDDLPCFDDAAERRGRPTAHVLYGVPIAVLTGPCPAHARVRDPGGRARRHASTRAPAGAHVGTRDRRGVWNHRRPEHGAERRRRRPGAHPALPCDEDQRAVSLCGGGRRCGGELDRSRSMGTHRRGHRCVVSARRRSRRRPRRRTVGAAERRRDVGQRGGRRSNERHLRRGHELRSATVAAEPLLELIAELRMHLRRIVQESL